MMFVVLNLIGCGISSTTSVVTQSSENAYQAAVQAMGSKDYGGAVTNFDVALNGGGLNADLVGNAIFMRAKCYIELGRLEDASRDLEDARSGPVPAEEVLCARGEVAMKMGDKEKARRLYTKAREINRDISWPDEL